MPFILGTNSIKDTGYNVANSLRFNSASSDSLDVTHSSAGNQKTFTISFWTKLSSVATARQAFLNAGVAGSTNVANTSFEYRDNAIKFGGGNNLVLVTTQLFRDVSAWYHIVLAVDTTQGTAANRVKLYINGTKVTSFATESYPSQNDNYAFNDDVIHYIGSNLDGASNFHSGYFSEFVMIDGSQLAADSFGEFDSDSPTIWKPINVSGLTFGTNGFYLEFKQAGTSANSSGLGADTSGNDHHFDVNNLTAVDQSTDTCTNNFCTLNPLDNFYAGSTFSDGNLTLATGADERTPNSSTMGVSTGKWYWEVKLGSNGANAGYIGIQSGQTANDGVSAARALGYNQYDYAFNADEQIYTNNSTTSYGGDWTDGDIISVALDIDNSLLYFYINGSIQNSGTGVSIASPSLTRYGVYIPAVSDWKTQVLNFQFNFGSPPYAISSSNADANGHGNFEYAVPSGYFALCSKNLAEYG